MKNNTLARILRPIAATKYQEPRMSVCGKAFTAATRTLIFLMKKCFRQPVSGSLKWLQIQANSL